MFGTTVVRDRRLSPPAREARHRSRWSPLGRRRLSHRAPPDSRPRLLHDRWWSRL